MTLSQIEINLYKSALAYENLKEKDAMIDDIDKTHFLANLNMGTPSNPYPLQVQMDTEEIYIVNNKFKPMRNSLSTESSQTFQAEPIKENEYDSEAKDSISIGQKNFEINFQSSEQKSHSWR